MSTNNNSSKELKINTNEKSLEDLLDLFLNLIITNLQKKDDQVHSNIFCNNCSSNSIKIYRYKCLECDDYDLCSSCFEKRKFNGSHLNSHLMVRFDTPNELFGIKFNSNEVNLNNFEKLFKNEVHENVTCDGCKNNIVGLRFKCDLCEDYDLCLFCAKAKRETLSHKSDHPLIFVCNPSLEIDPDDIELSDKLGKGAFGEVYKAHLKKMDNKLVACKIISYHPIMKLINIDPDALVQSYIREIRAYNEVKGINILRMFGSFVRTTGGVLELGIITEFMEKGSLASVLKNEPNLSFRRRLEIACNIAAGMSRLHDKSIIHRDIRPDNILIDENYNAKIGDMGIAKYFRNSEKHTIMGFAPYMPLEFYIGKITLKLDIFTFGLTLLETFGGNHSKSENHAIKIEKNSQVLNDLISRCLENDYEKRPNANEIENYLEFLLKAVNNSIINYFGGFSVYISLNTEKKDKIFKIVHDLFVEKIRIQIEKSESKQADQIEGIKIDKPNKKCVLM